MKNKVTPKITLTECKETLAELFRYRNVGQESKRTVNVVFTGVPVELAKKIDKLCMRSFVTKR